MAEALRINRVVVGADPSPGARAALHWAMAFAGSCDAELVLVHARGLLEAFDHADDVPEWLSEMLAEVGAEIMLSLVVEDGPPPEALLRAAGEVGADLIVVGKRGAGSPFDLTMGSTSREVTSRATVPVLVVPADHG